MSGRVHGWLALTALLLAGCADEREMTAPADAGPPDAAALGAVAWLRTLHRPGDLRGARLVPVRNGIVLAVDDRSAGQIRLVRFDAAGGARWIRAIPASSLAGLQALTDDGVLVGGADVLARYSAAGTSRGVQRFDRGFSLQAFEGEGLIAGRGPEGALVVARRDRAWSRRVEGNVSASALFSRPDGGALVTGTFQESVRIGRGELGERTLRCGGQAFALPGVFFAKLGPSGDLVWSRTICGLQVPARVVQLDDGGFVAAGTYSYAAFGFEESRETVLFSRNGDMPFLARYTARGRVAWAVGASGDHGGNATGSAIARSADGLVVAGWLSGLVTMGDRTLVGPPPWLRAGFVARYGADGAIQDARVFAPDVTPTAVAVADDGALYVAGTTFAADGVVDGFVARLAP